MDELQVEQALREFFARDPHGAVAVYLFGSVGRMEARADSDVDVGVLFEKIPPSTLDSMPFQLDGELEELLRTEVDVVSLNTASADLRYRVIRDGRIVLDADRSRRLAFEVATRNEYWDLLPILRRVRRMAS
ncbi:MAG TPA: nucleotidyltransferase domain-containing protein [Thermoanaerobaculia bacterium]|nr:nucleotidyltransferase domain-containing protein [Thermoanaerobaculia bacterium]